MLHELLLSLLGKPGAIIKQFDKEFKVDASVTFLSSAEASLINQIAQTGFYYSQIIKFIDYELTESSYNDFKKTPSIYRKAMAQGLRKTIAIYQSLILGIQSDYLKSKYFTFSNIRAETTKFELIMREICELLTRITNQKYRGGNIVDILWEVLQKGNQWLKDWIAMMFKECASVFVRQIAAWIAHGQIIDTEDEFFIHKIVQEPQEKFRFTKNQSKNVELTGWDIYTLDQSLIPLSLISSQTAGKILFIGKSVKILRSSGKISAIPSAGILGEMKLLFEQQYCQILLQSMIERIRHSIAQEMIELIIGEQNLLRQLEKINEYYLMLKGDFYHHFLQEAKCVENIPHKERMQRKINETCLQNTFIRLNNLEDAKRVSFEIKPLGFAYVGFKNFLNLCPVGNIDLVQGKFVRFSASGGALWHRTKQIVENNFTVTFAISFKKSKTVFKTKKEDEKDKFSNMISLVFQNSRDISTSFHENPSSLAKIPEYLSINIGYRFSELQKNYESLITITYKNEKKHSKQTKQQV